MKRETDKAPPSCLMLTSGGDDDGKGNGENQKDPCRTCSGCSNRLAWNIIRAWRRSGKLAGITLLWIMNCGGVHCLTVTCTTTKCTCDLGLFSKRE